MTPLRRVVASLDRRLGAVIGPLVRWVAVERTERICTGRVLILAPHPDDETLACGGVIARTVARGGHVVLAVATDGRHGDERVAPQEMAARRDRELTEAVRVLGLASGDVIQLGFEDATLAANEAALADAVRTLVERERPDVVLGPCPWDLHPDHAALGRCLPRWSEDGPAVLGYLVWGWDQPLRLLRRATRDGPERASRRPARRWPVAVDVTDLLETKAAALRCHRSQFTPDARLAGRAVGGTGPLDSAFLARFGGRRELFFPLGRA